MVLLALPPADHLLIERDRGQFVPSRRRRMMANVRAERLLKIPAEPSPELRIPHAAAQTRMVSVAGIRLGSGESAVPYGMPSQLELLGVPYPAALIRGWEAVTRFNSWSNCDVWHPALCQSFTVQLGTDDPDNWLSDCRHL
jgi:hypothetical protein